MKRWIALLGVEMIIILFLSIVIKDINYELENRSKLLEKASIDNKSLLEYKNTVEKENKLLEDKVIELEKYIAKLNEKAYFDSSDLTKVSKVTEKELKLVLINTNMVELVPYIIEAENRYGINALFMTGLIANESNWNTSQKATTMNNITGFGVFNYKVRSRGRNFDSKAECIMATAQLLSESYLDQDGSFYNGKGVEDVNIRYCLTEKGEVDYNWSKTIISIANNLKNEINSY